VRVISYGGGVQSTAMIVLAAQGKLGPVTDAIFANVGDDSEHPATLRYVREVMTPWAAARGILVHEVQRTRRNGTPVTLMGVLQSSRRSIDIPVRMANGAPGNRNCTSEFKIKVLGKWLKQHGGAMTMPVTTLVGISWDEVERVGRRRNNSWEIVEYPLIDMRLSRHDCQRIIASAGLPVPGKSSCWFCPFFRPVTWARMRRDEPELFGQAAALEATLNARRDTLGKDHVWLTRFAKPLADAIPVAQDDLFDDLHVTHETCDEGACWT